MSSFSSSAPDFSDFVWLSKALLIPDNLQIQVLIIYYSRIIDVIR